LCDIHVVIEAQLVYCRVYNISCARPPWRPQKASTKGASLWQA